MHDVFDEVMPVCDEKEGVDSVMRYSLLRHRLATLKQPSWVPSFTEKGSELPNVMMGMMNVARMKLTKQASQESCIVSTVRS